MVSEESHRITNRLWTCVLQRGNIKSPVSYIKKLYPAAYPFVPSSINDFFIIQPKQRKMRNVFFDEESVIVGRRCQTADTNRNTSFWALAPKMTNPFLFFSGIVKLVGQRILKQPV